MLLNCRVCACNNAPFHVTQCIGLPTFDSSPSMFLLISVHLLTEHWLFHGRTPASGTEVSLLLEHFAVYVTTDDQLLTV